MPMPVTPFFTMPPVQGLTERPPDMPTTARRDHATASDLHEFRARTAARRAPLDAIAACEAIVYPLVALPQLLRTAVPHHTWSGSWAKNMRTHFIPHLEQYLLQSAPGALRIASTDFARAQPALQLALVAGLRHILHRTRLAPGDAALFMGAPTQMAALSIRAAEPSLDARAATLLLWGPLLLMPNCVRTDDAATLWGKLPAAARQRVCELSSSELGRCLAQHIPTWAAWAQGRLLSEADAPDDCSQDTASLGSLLDIEAEELDDLENSDLGNLEIGSGSTNILTCVGERLDTGLSRAGLPGAKISLHQAIAPFAHHWREIGEFLRGHQDELAQWPRLAWPVVEGLALVHHFALHEEAVKFPKLMQQRGAAVYLHVLQAQSKLAVLLDAVGDADALPWARQAAVLASRKIAANPTVRPLRRDRRPISPPQAWPVGGGESLFQTVSTEPVLQPLAEPTKQKPQRKTDA